MPLINCEIELDLEWSKYCVISEISRTPEVQGTNPAEATLTTGATFKYMILNFIFQLLLYLLMIISNV